MTTLIDRIRVWASSGATATPTDAKIDTGWVGGEQPPHEWENDRMNVRDSHLVKCVDAINDSPAGGRTLFKDRNIAANILENIGLPYSSDNKYDSGDAKIDASCLYEYEGVKKVFFSWTPSSGTKGIKSVDVNTGAGLSYLFSADLIVSMCSTGQYIYVLYATLSGANYIYYLTVLDGGTWLPKASWVADPEVGRQPSASLDSRPFCRVTPLGNILCGGRWIDASGGTKFSVVDSDTGSILEAGDAGMGLVHYPSGDCVVVDGMLVYTGFLTTGGMFTGVVDETDLSTHGGGTLLFNLYSTATIAGQYMSLVSLGDYYIVGYTGSSNNELLMLSMDGTETWPVVDILGTYNILGPMFFDGVNVWILLYVSDGSGVTGMMVRKFNPQSLSENTTDVVIDTSEDTDKNHFLALAGTNTEIGQIRPPMVFDGAGLWVSPYASAGNDFSGEWFRISNVYSR